MSVAEISWFINKISSLSLLRVVSVVVTGYYIYSKVVINGVDSFRFSGIMFVSERHNRCASKMRVFKLNARKDIDPRKCVKCISWDVEEETKIIGRAVGYEAEIQSRCVRQLLGIVKQQEAGFPASCLCY